MEYQEVGGGDTNGGGVGEILEYIRTQYFQGYLSSQKKTL